MSRWDLYGNTIKNSQIISNGNGIMFCNQNGNINLNGNIKSLKINGVKYPVKNNSSTKFSKNGESVQISNSYNSSTITSTLFGMAIGFIAGRYIK